MILRRLHHWIAQRRIARTRRHRIRAAALRRHAEPASYAKTPAGEAHALTLLRPL